MERLLRVERKVITDVELVLFAVPCAPKIHGGMVQRVGT